MCVVEQMVSTLVFHQPQRVHVTPLLITLSHLCRPTDYNLRSYFTSYLLLFEQFFKCILHS